MIDPINLSHAKRHWHKARLRMLSVEIRNQYGNEVVMYIGDRKYRFACYSPDVTEMLQKANPQELLNIWFTCKSREYQERWYTELLLKWVEIPRIKKTEKLEEQLREKEEFGMPSSGFGCEED
jgi:hypothetical protein